jgi:hypothetical protein
MTEKAEQVLSGLVSKISSETAAGFLNYRLFSSEVDIPCRKWSALNQFITYLFNTQDARGIRQWNNAGRSVTKGRHPFYIIIPMIKRFAKESGNKIEESENTGAEEFEEKLAGFKAMPVFRAEDTYGKELDYKIILNSFDPESFPLINVARKLGISVEARLTEGYYGSYTNSLKKIVMGTDEKSIFLHELSHAVDFKLPNRKEDYAFGEIVAELSSAFLGSLYDIKIDIPAVKAYIERYSGKINAAFKIIEALERVKAIYQFIESVKD